MVRYDFDEVVERRGTTSVKWDPETLIEKFGQADLLPFWVADMDFKVAKPIVDAVVRCAEHGIFGYAKRPEGYFQALIDWIDGQFGWKVEQEWIEHAPGVVPALNSLIQAYCGPGEGVLIQEPVYYPFARSINNNGRRVVNNQLLYADGQYHLDLADFAAKVKDPALKLFILCNPHNPVSRVWTPTELEQMGRICLENDVLVISDEIHNDLIFPEYKHTMFASISDEFAMNSITCTAPSKTFNLAGLQTSNLIIPNAEHRAKYQRIVEVNNIDLKNPISIAAVEAAYREGHEWLEQLLVYLQDNLAYIRRYLAMHLPKARLIEPQATYLAWIDLSCYCADGTRLEEVVIQRGKVALDGGTWFGQGGDGFVRLNFACPRSLLEEGLTKLCESVNSLEGGKK